MKKLITSLAIASVLSFNATATEVPVNTNDEVKTEVAEKAYTPGLGGIPALVVYLIKLPFSSNETEAK